MSNVNSTTNATLKLDAAKLSDLPKYKTKTLSTAMNANAFKQDSTACILLEKALSGLCSGVSMSDKNLTVLFNLDKFWTLLNKAQSLLEDEETLPIEFGKVNHGGIDVWFVQASNTSSLSIDDMRKTLSERQPIANRPKFGMLLADTKAVSNEVITELWGYLTKGESKQENLYFVKFGKDDYVIVADSVESALNEVCAK